MARDEPMVNIRMPAGLKRALEEASYKSRRSLTAEICDRLERSLAVDLSTDGVNEDAAGYDVARLAIEALPDSVRGPTIELLRLAARGRSPDDTQVLPLRSNKPKPPPGDRTAHGRGKRGANQSGKGSDR